MSTSRPIRPAGLRRDSDSDDDDNAASLAGEASPLLAQQMDGNDNDVPPEVWPDSLFRQNLLILCMVFVIIVELGAYLQVPPTNKLMEEIICRQEFPDMGLHPSGPSGDGPGDDPCQSNAVQERIALIRGWSNAFDTIGPLVTGIPYGIIADKYGRRIVLFLSILGLTIQQYFQVIPLIWPQTFPLWTVWFGSLFQFIGGGAGMLVAMVWTMLADSNPVAERMSVYFKLTAAITVGELLVNPLSAFLMSRDAWFPIGLGLILLTIGTALTLVVPETLRIRQEADEIIEEREAAAGESSQRPAESSDEESVSHKGKSLRHVILATMKEDFTHVWRFLIGSRTILLLILSFTFSVLVKYAKIELFLQYVRKRFGWSWESATLLLTIGSLTNLVTVLIILPVVGWFINKHLGRSPVVRDLWLTRGTGVLLVSGCVVLGFAFTPFLLVIGLTLFSFGSAYTTVLRGVLNELVEPHTIGTLNTTISVVEMIGLLISAPILSQLFRTGMSLGGVWTGLPYMAASGLAAVGVAIVFIYRAPRE